MITESTSYFVRKLTKTYLQLLMFHIAMPPLHLKLYIKKNIPTSLCTLYDTMYVMTLHVCYNVVYTDSTLIMCRSLVNLSTH